MGFRLLAPSMLQHHVLATAGRVWMENDGGKLTVKWESDQNIQSVRSMQGSLSDSWLQLQDRVWDEEVQVCEG